MRTPGRIDQSLADAAVIERAQVEQANGHTLPELLAQQPGVQFWSNNGVGKIGSVSLRGLESRHTLLLIDGIRYGSATVDTPTWGTSFVAPSFNQLYLRDFGNPNLLPEEGAHRELSLRWQAVGANARLAWFDNRIWGYISSGPLPVNVPFARVDGFSASGHAALGAWSVSASIDRLNPVDNTGDTANFGKIPPRRVQDSARMALDWNVGALKLGGTLSAHGARFDNVANTIRVGGYSTVDLRADCRIAKALVLGLRLNNVSDKSYETVHSYNQPGRDVRVTLRYSGA